MRSILLTPGARWLAAGLTAALAAFAVVAIIDRSPPGAPAGHGRSAPGRPAGQAHARSGHRSAAASAPGRVVVHVAQTTATLSQRMQRLPDQWLRPGASAASRIVTVRDTIRGQTILGFGAALTDSAAWLIHDELSPAARSALMQRLFGTGGIHLSYIRLPMGASDFTVARRAYSYDDLPAGASDPRLARFSVAHDVPYIIPTLREALAINPGLFIIANPWSAPAWMKTNQRLDNVAGTGSLRPDDDRALAGYFVKFLQAYQSHGVTVDAITPQNEPGVRANPAMNLAEADEESFITRYLRPALGAAGLSTKIFGHDMNWNLSAYAEGLATGLAKTSLSGISWHCYFGSPAAMTQLHATAPQLTQVVNECSPEIMPFSPGEALIGSLRNWASGVAFWNLALDPSGGPVQPPGRWCAGCRGLVTIERSTHRARLGPRYYQLGQVSKFVSPGAVRIDATTFVSDTTDSYGFYRPTPGLDDVAFINPNGEKVLVTDNSSPRPVTFSISWHGRSMAYRQPAGAITTFAWR